MQTSEIKALIEQGIEASEAIVSGDGGKYEAIVISAAFEGLSMLKQHQLVYATVNDQITSGELHALTIKAYTPEQWQQHTN